MSPWRRMRSLVPRPTSAHLTVVGVVLIAAMTAFLGLSGWGPLGKLAAQRVAPTAAATSPVSPQQELPVLITPTPLPPLVAAPQAATPHNSGAMGSAPTARPGRFQVQPTAAPGPPTRSSDDGGGDGG